MIFSLVRTRNNEIQISYLTTLSVHAILKIQKVANSTEWLPNYLIDLKIITQSFGRQGGYFFVSLSLLFVYVRIATTSATTLIIIMNSSYVLITTTSFRRWEPPGRLTTCFILYHVLAFITNFITVSKRLLNCFLSVNYIRLSRFIGLLAGRRLLFCSNHNSALDPLAFFI